MGNHLVYKNYTPPRVGWSDWVGARFQDILDMHTLPSDQLTVGDRLTMYTIQSIFLLMVLSYVAPDRATATFKVLVQHASNAFHTHILPPAIHHLQLVYRYITVPLRNAHAKYTTVTSHINSFHASCRLESDKFKRELSTGPTRHHLETAVETTANRVIYPTVEILRATAHLVLLIAILTWWALQKLPSSTRAIFSPRVTKVSRKLQFLNPAYYSPSRPPPLEPQSNAAEVKERLKKQAAAKALGERPCHYHTISIPDIGPKYRVETFSSRPPSVMRRTGYYSHYNYGMNYVHQQPSYPSYHNPIMYQSTTTTTTTGSWLSSSSAYASSAYGNIYYNNARHETSGVGFRYNDHHYSGGQETEREREEKRMIEFRKSLSDNGKQGATGMYGMPVLPVEEPPAEMFGLDRRA